MGEDGRIAKREEGLVRALSTPDLRKLANARHALVPAGGGVAGLPGSPAHESRGEGVGTAAKERAEQANLLSRCLRNATDRLGWRIDTRVAWIAERRELRLEGGEAGPRLDPLGVGRVFTVRAASPRARAREGGPPPRPFEANRKRIGTAKTRRLRSGFGRAPLPRPRESAGVSGMVAGSGRKVSATADWLARGESTANPSRWIDSLIRRENTGNSAGFEGTAAGVADRKTPALPPPSAGFPWALEQGTTARRSGSFPPGTGKPMRLLPGTVWAPRRLRPPPSSRGAPRRSKSRSVDRWRRAN